MNARIRRLAVVLGLAAAALAGAGVTAATTSTTEAATRASLTACVVVDEAVKLGVNPIVEIPATFATCHAYSVTRRFGR